MQTNKILSADFLDILFDGRNKEYGAYELRKTYQQRVAKALFATITISLLIFTGTVLAGSKHLQQANRAIDNGLIITEIAETKPELPKPEKKPEVVQPRTEIYTAPLIVENVVKPLPSIEELDHAQIDVLKQDGIDPDSLSYPRELETKGLIEKKENTESDEPIKFVEVEAKFTGNWQKFLERNLNPEVPINNGAPAANYSIDIQFVVDIEGNVSDIKPLTNLGYGMEQEAVRVLKKATKWEPAIQNGRKVKAYRRQRIIFQVLGE
ncbi:MAG: energy transducer TonB [Chitinophagaceae bacterium]